ncbi:MAG: response regulator [Spirochaetia bacterium]|nr:response regulator [Spirochaetia bacterium]
MITVLVVDDEPLQLKMIRKTIPWDELGMNIIGEAQDGSKAIAMAEKTCPDIIIMDINIPHYNGLEAARMITSALPDTQILILTAYNKFTYAKQAIELGVLSFVLKPLDPEELVRGLRKARTRILQIKKEKNKILTLEQRVRNDGRKQTVLELLSGVPNSRLMFQESKLEGKICIAAFLEINMETKNIIKDFAMYMFPYAPCFDSKGIFIIIFCSGQLDDKTYFSKIKESYALYETKLKNKLCGAISTVYQTPSELYLAWQEILSILPQARETNSFVIMTEKELSHILADLPFRQNQMLVYLRLQQYDKAMHEVKAALILMKSHQEHQKFYILFAILSTFSLYFAEKGQNFHTLFADEIAQMDKATYKNDFSTIAHLIQCIMAYVQLPSPTAAQSAVEEKVNKAAEYVNLHFKDKELSLSIVAQEVGVNPNYLCDIFKKNKKQSLRAYIIATRLEFAMTFMREHPNFTLAAVADEAGYTDVSYFSKSFKKYFGCSPSHSIKQI